MGRVRSGREELIPGEGREIPEKRAMKNIKSYKNIVFDMGKVLIDYDEDRVSRKFSGNEALIREVHNTVFCSSEWLKLDAGLISEEEAERRWLPRLSSEEARELARKAFSQWHLYNMREKPGIAEIIRGLHERGQRIFILSNASLRLPSCYRRVMPLPELYDGVFFSAEHRCIKPQDIIYERFFRLFSLRPSECFFVDDLPENIEAASAAGMDGFVFSDGRAEMLKELFEL